MILDTEKEKSPSIIWWACWLYNWHFIGLMHANKRRRTKLYVIKEPKNEHAPA